MFRKTFTGSLVAASLTAGALLTMPSASATPTFVSGTNVSGVGNLPTDADFAMAENGTAVATWIRDGRVVAASRPAGTWHTDYVTAPGTVVSNPTVSTNDKGETVVAWMQTDQFDDIRVAAARMDAEGNFPDPQLISTAGSPDVQAPLDAAVDGKGKLFVAYEISNGGGFDQVRVSTLDKAGTADTKSVSGTSAHQPSIAVNTAGQALIAYNEEYNADDVINTRRFDPSNQTWSATKSVGLVGKYTTESDVALGDDGFGTVVYGKKVDADFRAMTSTSKPDATLGGAVYASPAGYTAAFFSVDQNDKGAALVSYTRIGGGNYVGYTQRATTTGNWTNPAIVSGALSGLSASHATISDSGFAFIGFDDNEHQRAAYRSSVIQNMTTYDSGDTNYVYGGTGVGSDNQGNVLFAGIIHSADPAKGFISAKILDTAGPTSTVSAPASSVGTTFKVSRAASDRFSNLGNGSIRVRSAKWDSNLGNPTIISSNSAATSLDFTGKPGYTYCFSSLAKDSHANTGAWSAEKCTTVAHDDRHLFNAKKFKRVKSGAAYQGTLSKATTKNAKLILQDLKVRKIAIVVKKSAHGGKIKVSFGGKKLGTYSLKGKGSKQVINVKDLGSVKTGTLVIKVISKSGKTVKIDGVIATR
ncbi:hypothetical protein ABIE44_001625 [Marmoricola sp. OAE513]|uniref:hypothetical protein n=1 Tax=Marmoricola sp. OAE513 TaxID=2817894 RepID=UPI001AEA5AAC